MHKNYYICFLYNKTLPTFHANDSKNKEMQEYAAILTLPRAVSTTSIKKILNKSNKKREAKHRIGSST